MKMRTEVRLLSGLLLLAGCLVPVAAQSSKATAPETFRANAQITDQGLGAAVTITVRVERYTSDADHDALAKALKDGGYPAFLTTLRAMPVVGTLKMRERSVPIRWARQETTATGRRITAITESPVYFFGAGSADAKPTAGFDIGAMEFTSDGAGMGKGTLSGAARVKAGGPTGVEVEDYAGKRIVLLTVTRELS